MAEYAGMRVVVHEAIDEGGVLLAGPPPDRSRFDSDAEWWTAWARRCGRIVGGGDDQSATAIAPDGDDG